MKTPKLVWTKAPSVTTGGKPYFWFTDIGVIRHWVMWDRVDHKWTVQTLRNNCIKQFKSDSEAKKWAERNLST